MLLRKRQKFGNDPALIPCVAHRVLDILVPEIGLHGKVRPPSPWWPTLVDDPDAQKHTAVKEPSSGHEVEITQHCQVRVDASTGGVMSKRTFDTATEDLMAYNNRM
jgi:hypothetical protein